MPLICNLHLSASQWMSMFVPDHQGTKLTGLGRGIDRLSSLNRFSSRFILNLSTIKINHGVRIDFLLYSVVEI